jgi:hypothetical protein
MTAVSPVCNFHAQKTNSLYLHFRGFECEEMVMVLAG